MAVSEKLPIKGFKWMVDISGIDQNFVKSYNKNSGKGYLLKVDVDFPRELQNLHCDLPFLPEKMVVNNTKKLICNLQDKKDYVVHINVLKRALDHGLKLIKVHQVTENIHNDKCLKCMSNLCFVNAVNETLTFECVDCKKEYKKDINNKDFRMCINFVVMT